MNILRRKRLAAMNEPQGRGAVSFLGSLLTYCLPKTARNIIALGEKRNYLILIRKLVPARGFEPRAY